MDIKLQNSNCHIHLLFLNYWIYFWIFSDAEINILLGSIFKLFISRFRVVTPEILIFVKFYISLKSKEVIACLLAFSYDREEGRYSISNKVKLPSIYNEFKLVLLLKSRWVRHWFDKFKDFTFVFPISKLSSLFLSIFKNFKC